MRLITRADLDGLTCALLLKEVEPIDTVDFAHPKDVQDGKVAVSENDILANLPYDERAAMWFDHHVSQADFSWNPGMKGAFDVAPSAARVIANHYKSPKFDRYATLLEETDRLDAAILTKEDIVDPQGWILIGYTLDPRSQLPHYQDYFRHVMDLASKHTPDEILADPQVKERVDALRTQEEAFLAHLQADSVMNGNVVVTDMRGKGDAPTGNRFLIYTLFPEANVSMRIADGFGGEKVSIQLGHSILNRTCHTNVGELLAMFGGGGHEGAGTCQPAKADADRVIAEILSALHKNG
jgi:nanoRNase/pAp phosphatase (c-di-AMP/oligoRNAs hydrolase)